MFGLSKRHLDVTILPQAKETVQVNIPESNSDLKSIQ